MLWRSRRASSSKSRRFETARVARRSPSEPLSSAVSSAAEERRSVPSFTRLTISAPKGRLIRDERRVQEDRLAGRLALWCGDDQERARGVSQQLFDSAGALAKAVDEPRQRAEEDRQIAEQIDAADAPQGGEQQTASPSEEASRHAAGRQEHGQRPAFEETSQASGRVEESDRVA